MTNTWKKIERSPLLDVYRHELYWLAADVVNRAEAVFERTPPPKPTYAYIKVEAELHADIYAMLGSAAKIRALITERPKRRSQSTEAYKLLCERSCALAALLDGIELEATLSAEVRHSLEHFDERIDSTAEAIVSGSTPAPVHIPSDMTVWDRGTLDVLKGTGDAKPKLVLLRVYVAVERVFVNAGHEIDVAKLHQEAKAITKRLKPFAGPTEEGRGAPVFVITEQSLRD